MVVHLELGNHQRGVQEPGEDNGIHDALPLLLQAAAHRHVEEPLPLRVGPPWSTQDRRPEGKTNDQMLQIYPRRG